MAKKYNVALAVLLVGLFSARAISQPLAQGKSKFLGVGTGSNIWSGLHVYWNQVTPGNDGKWGSVEGTQGQFNWTNLDAIYNYTVSRSFRYKHHTLVWGQQQPSWIGSLDSAAQRAAVENWIQNVGQRYPSMAMVDVVNEPFHAPPVYANALGGVGASGYDWVITSFRMARQYSFPGVKLILNEYNVLHSNTVTTNYIRLIDTLKARNLIDGIGIQGHYFEFRSDIGSPNPYVYDINTIKANLDRLAGTGLPVYITEFDIDEPVDANQLAQYQIYFPIFWTHPGVKGITFWGYIQNDVWTSHPNTYLFLTNGTERPALQWMRTYVNTPVPPLLVSPVNTSGEARNARMVWKSSVLATSYRLQVSTNITFASTVVDTMLTDTVCRVNPLTANTRHYWRVSAAGDSGVSAYSSTGIFVTGDQIVAVNETRAMPTEFALEQNYPNPFNPITIIRFTIHSSQFTILKVFDVLGREVATLVNEELKAGSYERAFDGSNFASGVYFYRLQSGGMSSVRRLLLLR